MSDVGAEEIQEVKGSSEADKLPFEDRPETIRYGEIVHGEARSILEKYLPEALPQEPTEITFDLFPQYIGAFKGRHYIALERILLSDNTMQRFKEESDRLREAAENYRKEMDEFVRALEEEAKKDEPDFDSVERRLAHPTQDKPNQEPKKPEKEDWEEPERLLRGRQEFSADTWRSILVAVHELMHQKQAELHPHTLTYFTPEDIDDADFSNLPNSEKFVLLQKAHRSKVLSMDEKERNSMLYPVIEGTAVLGTYLVMGQLADDLEREGQSDVAARIREAQRQQLFNELTAVRDTEGNPVPDPYKQNYQKGFKIIKKLYRRFGPKKTPEVIRNIDLTTLRSISQGSEQYQRMMEDPTLLPGLADRLDT